MLSLGAGDYSGTCEPCYMHCRKNNKQGSYEIRREHIASSSPQPQTLNLKPSMGELADTAFASTILVQAVFLLGGPWDLVTTYNWAYNPTYNPFK